MKHNENVMVFTSQIARQLLREGYQIVDIKPDKLDSDGKRSVFIFKHKDGLIDDVKRLSMLNNK